MNKLLRKIFLIYVLSITLSLWVLGPFIGNPQSSHLLIFLSAIAISVILCFVMVIILLGPIAHIRDIASQISSGDYSKRLTMRSKGELDGLANDLNMISTELGRKFDELQKERNELKTILSNMVEGVIVIGVDERILLLSPSISKMLDLRFRDVEGKLFWEVIRNAPINALIKDVLRSKKAIKKEISIIVFPEEFYFNIQVTPILDAAGQLLSLVAVFHDVTEFKKMENMRKEFVANVSHELKTPLTSIKGFVETLQSGALEDKDAVFKFLNIIQEQTRKLENLVNDILNLSAMESGEVMLNASKFDLNVLFEKLLDTYHDAIQKKNLRVFWDQGKGPIAIFADFDKLEQALSNVVDNAIKYTPDKGDIIIRSKKEDGNIIIEIEDTGMGIPKEHIQRIFERFYRVDKSRSRELGGTGLGLSIVKHIVQAHKGQVTVKSELQKGSTFSIVLPQ